MCERGAWARISTQVSFFSLEGSFCYPLKDAFLHQTGPRCGSVRAVDGVNQVAALKRLVLGASAPGALWCRQAIEGSHDGIHHTDGSVEDVFVGVGAAAKRHVASGAAIG